MDNQQENKTMDYMPEVEQRASRIGTKRKQRKSPFMNGERRNCHVC